MLAVFNKSVAKCPEGLKCSSVESDAASACALKDDFLLGHFTSQKPEAISIHLGSSSGCLAYSLDPQNPLVPRLFSAEDDVFCLFQGHIENIAELKQLYGLTKTANEVHLIVQAYRSLRDRKPNPPDRTLRTIQGKYVFVVYDSSLKSTFIAVDADGSVPLYWGTDSEESLVLSDDEEVVKKACGRSYAPFPKGCFFTSSGGLKSFEHPRKELKVVPWKDSSEQTCGGIFVVGSECIKESPMPRVGSDGDWSREI